MVLTLSLVRKPHFGPSARLGIVKARDVGRAAVQSASAWLDRTLVSTGSQSEHRIGCHKRLEIPQRPEYRLVSLRGGALGPPPRLKRPLRSFVPRDAPLASALQVGQPTPASPRARPSMVSWRPSRLSPLRTRLWPTIAASVGCWRGFVRRRSRVEDPASPL